MEPSRTIEFGCSSTGVAPTCTGTAVLASHVGIAPPTAGTLVTANPHSVSTAGSDWIVRTELSTQRAGDGIAETGITVTQSPTASSLEARLEFERAGGTLTGTISVTERDRLGAVAGNTNTALTAEAIAALEGGAQSTYELRVDAAFRQATVRLDVAGTTFETPPLALFAMPDQSIASALQWSVLNGQTPATTFDLEVDQLEILASVSTFVPLFNIDIGASAGTPPDTYAAAGSAGTWNLLDNAGPQTLDDVFGVAQPVTANLVAPSTGGFTSGAGELKGDHAEQCSPSSWTVDLAGLEIADYRVIVYAPANGSRTGPIEVNGRLEVRGLGSSIPSIPGDPGPGLTEGISWDSTTTFVTDSNITIKGTSPGVCVGVAGARSSELDRMYEGPALAQAATGCCRRRRE